jgi:hypothetical protein
MSTPSLHNYVAYTFFRDLTVAKRALCNAKIILLNSYLNKVFSDVIFYDIFLIYYWLNLWLKLVHTKIGCHVIVDRGSIRQHILPLNPHGESTSLNFSNHLSFNYLMQNHCPVQYGHAADYYFESLRDTSSNASDVHWEWWILSLYPVWNIKLAG